MKPDRAQEATIVLGLVVGMLAAWGLFLGGLVLLFVG